MRMVCYEQALKLAIWRIEDRITEIRDILKEQKDSVINEEKNQNFERNI